MTALQTTREPFCIAAVSCRRVSGAPSLLLAVLVAGCAARTTAPSSTVDVARADALLATGCHECLTVALGIYDGVATRRGAPSSAARGAWQAAALLFIRAKELGLPVAQPQQDAEARAGRLAAIDPAFSSAPYFDAIALAAGEASGWDPEEREHAARERRARWTSDGSIPAARQKLDTLPDSDILRHYIALFVDCDDGQRRTSVSSEAVLTRFPMMLFRFRLTVCGFERNLGALREQDPRWTDTLFLEGRREMTIRPVADVVKAADLLAAAQAAFPQSDAITLALAGARNALSEHEAALALFDGVLSKQPAHRDALLGRVISLSYLNRHSDAVTAATQMIALGTWHMGEAYYWRAWNRYHRYELDAAWEDIETGRQLSITSAVYSLAGVIAYARKQLDTSVARLRRAFELDASNCDAVWTEGLVNVDLQAWSQAGQRFARAMTCFESQAATARKEMEELSGASDAVRSRRLGPLQKRADTAWHRESQSAFNAASSHLRLGEKREASLYAERAAAHPLLKEKADALLSTIARLPQ